MAVRDAYPKPRLPTSHYFFSLAHGERMRTLALRPWLFWSILALVPIMAVWSLGATLFIACHDDMLGAIVAREAEMQYAYEDRLADARAQLDRVTSRQLLDQNSFEGKVHELLSRQAQLEQRTAIVASMAGQAGLGDTTGVIAERSRPGQALANPKGPATALMAIGAARAQAPADSVLDSVKAFAPIGAEDATRTPAKPRPLEEPRERPDHTSALPGDARGLRASADLIDTADNPDVAAPTRLSLISHSLDRMERRQLATLGEIETAAGGTIARLRGVMDEAGIGSERLPAAPRTLGGVGGPYIPIIDDKEAPAFDKAVSSVERSLLVEDRLRRFLPFAPVRHPLIGDAEVSSPFGYRPDPFLGRPALHPGVDLVQAYGATIKATGAGRVIHAGPMGGYGNMVEIDHGGGLTTRYGHMSEILVGEGDQVEAGAPLGRLGSTGRSTGPHLHYEVRVDGEPVDPTRFLRAGAGLSASE
jgi:murein DD-endopeptidase MepM/ murein hydrolase activator NlpD